MVFRINDFKTLKIKIQEYDLLFYVGVPVNVLS